MSRVDDVLVVGFERFGDFFPDLVADNLTAGGVPASAVALRIPELVRRRFVNGSVLAGLFDDPAFRRTVAGALAATGRSAARIGFPAVLGLRHAAGAVADLAELLGAEVFEIPVTPPSIPGMRIQHILRTAIAALGGRVIDNAEAVAVDGSDGGVQVLTEAAARRQHHRAASVVVATGGLLGGGLVASADGSLREVVANLPVAGPSSREEWFSSQVGPGGHPVYRAGVKVSPDLAVAEHVYVAGNLLFGADPVEEGSLEGIALATGWVAGRNAAAAAGSRS